MAIASTERSKSQKRRRHPPLLAYHQQRATAVRLPKHLPQVSNARLRALWSDSCYQGKQLAGKEFATRLPTRRWGRRHRASEIQRHVQTLHTSHNGTIRAWMGPRLVIKSVYLRCSPSAKNPQTKFLMFNRTNVLSNLEPSKKTMGSHAGTPATTTAYLRQRTSKSSFIY